jgi:DNA recombination protein RmuC
MDAHEGMERLVIQQAAAAFESSIRAEARKIATKYVHPPDTTDFAILFVPTEGLFAEALRIPGLTEALQNDYRVVLAGPTTLSATLNSLLLGFRTLAIEQRSAEVWALLGSVKTEFRKFGEVVDSTRKSITAAANKFEELGRRTRAIERGLRSVEVLPAAAAGTALAIEPIAALDDSAEDSDGAVSE